MYTPINRRRVLQSCAGFPFFDAFSEKQIIVIYAKLDGVKGVVHIFPTTQPPCYIFRTAPLPGTHFGTDFNTIGKYHRVVM